ncbi:MAG: NAD(P)/FAD-dependent oxidoreductase [Liquorilactobacillus nagelii]|uniref:Pyridine nucleotide-disulfide oxidoreductase n=2 Tax=Liquorilactobacillus nagelii TaxID=82688 RepID=A0A3S6QUF6_9LACO|nr:NAD(P)/FAD-dependent oxidoreductase [Liquorilactobacillus nagelii]AUJ31704.1 pyridine nucleotide-disulfide oxidoreductase [Liquorilactobacillus nagelii]MCC7615926.1 pyridine nucleotide-disulfide oxidoreductase [Liquorilactobacillus nagelii]MCP9314233.1 NAD(P)/FAD-dependent oxidoreductase [Liquorilactobacillus nagelii]
MTKYDYDVMFIGSGHANWHAALALRKAGKRVVLIEKDLIAGTCTNYGCNAKILLDGAADVLHQAVAYQGKGITGELKIDWSALMAYKQKTINPLHLLLEQQFKAAGIEIVNGTAEFVDQHTVTAAGKNISAQDIIIGTGQRPSILPIPGKELMHDSRDFLDLPELPKHLTFIGAGIVSLEFAMLVRAAGAQVTVIEFADTALRGVEEKYVEQILQRMRDLGIELHFNEAVQSVVKQDSRLVVTTANGLKVTTDYVVAGTGRIPNVEELALDKVGVKFDKTGILVDDHLQTNVEHIYASGDVIAKRIPKLTPTATFESNYLAALLAGQTTAPIQYPVVASVIFTLPRIAQVGVTSAQAAAEDYQVVTIPYGARLRFQTKNEPAAEATLIFDQEHYLVGASVYGDEAPELINFLTMIISQKLTLNKLNQAVFAFPSQTIGLLSMLSPYLKQI